MALRDVIKAEIREKMLKRFTFGTSEIAYILLRRSNPNTIKVSVEFEHGVEVVAPMELSEEMITQILHQKGSWIIQKLKEIENVAETPPLREFVSGEKYLYLGRPYTLVVSEHAERRHLLILRNSIFEATVKPEMEIWDRQNTIRELFRAWYKQRAEAKLREQLGIYADRLNLKPTEVKVMEMDRRWGSCTPRGAVYLNWRLIMAPIKIIDYLVVHELCHLSIPEHSPKFWNLVGSVITDYEKRREWLRVNGPTLTV